MFCENHKERISAGRCALCGKAICWDCQKIVLGDVYCRSCVPFFPDVRRNRLRKNPCFAAIFSLLLPGGGQVYNNEVAKGILIFISSWLIFPWAFGVYDAYDIAKKINAGKYIPPISLQGWLCLVIIVLMTLGSPFVMQVAFRMYSSFDRADLEIMLARKNLKIVSQAAEKFFQNNNRYPMGFAELQFSAEAIGQELFCDLETEEYLYLCAFDRSGYLLIAQPKDKRGNKPVLKFATGGNYFEQ